MDAVLRRVGVEVVVEVSVDLLSLLSGLLNLWNPLSQLFLTVSIVEPRLLTLPMPPDIGEVGCEDGLRREERFIHNCVRNPILSQEAPCLRAEP